MVGRSGEVCTILAAAKRAGAAQAARLHNCAWPSQRTWLIGRWLASSRVACTPSSEASPSESSPRPSDVMFARARGSSAAFCAGSRGGVDASSVWTELPVRLGTTAL